MDSRSTAGKGEASPVSTHDPGRIRNLVILGPAGVGKTTLVEAMLFDMAMIPQRGRVDEGSTTTDFDSEAILRGISVMAAVAAGPWRDHVLHVIDTPGLSDFGAEARMALLAADAALLVVDAAKGVDANTRKLYGLAREAGLPVMVFINGVDAEQVQPYDAILAQLRDRLDIHAVPLELPVGKGSAFKGDVDLVGMRTWYFAPDSGKVTEVSEHVPEELTDAVSRYRTQLLEAVAELDDALLERYLGGEEPSSEELSQALRTDIREGKLLPVLCGSAKANLAIRPLLDAIVDLLPSPLEREGFAIRDADRDTEQTLPPTLEAPFSAIVFKTMQDPYLGKITLFRVRSGAIASEDHVRDPQRGSDERIGRLVKLVGKKPVPVDRLIAGDIGAVAKLKEVQTGDTLLAGAHGTRNLQYPVPDLPQAIFSVAIAPQSKGDEAKLAISLAKLKDEDPALKVSVEPKSHRTVLSGQGQLHLEVVLSRLLNRYNLDVKTSEPQIPYRETVSGSAKGQGKHKKQTGGRGQYGDVWLAIEPLPRGSGFQFVDAVVGGAVPRSFIPAVEKGVREMLEQGILAGFPIVDIKVTLFDGSFHSVDSSEMAFKTAAHLALKKIFMEAKPLLLEPILDLSITLPEEHLGDAMGDLNLHRAHVESLEGNTIHAKMPLGELATFIRSLQSFSRGQGTLESSFSHYQELPVHLAEKVLREETIVK
jgi:elongation factor G